jgi:molecular chaperone GrpE (heat shock protein)
MGEADPQHAAQLGDPRFEALQSGVANLGRGLVQVAARTARVQQLLESRDLASDPALLHAHLDLLDAVGDAVRALGPHAAADGLALATARAEDALARAGLTPIAPDLGERFDPETMRAVGDVPPADAHVVARTHRRGWARAGDAPLTLRPAWVTVAAAGSR